MKLKELNELEYELELKKIAETIKKQKAKRVLLQFPEGLKPYALKIEAEIEKLLGKTKTEILISLDSCFGACDIPVDSERLGVDLIVHFGHNEFIKSA